MVRRNGRELTDEEAKEFDSFQSQIDSAVENKEKSFDAELQAELARGNASQLKSDEEPETFDEFKTQFDKGQKSAKFKGVSNIANKAGDKSRDILKGSKQTLQRFGKVKKAGNIDPLKGMMRKSSGKRKVGRPRKYKPQAPSMRRVGRPNDVGLSLSGRPIVSNERVMGQIPDRGGRRAEQQREPFVAPSRSQMMMNEILGQSNQTWGFGGNPIRINRTLNSGRGLVKSGDDEGNTSSFFGGWRR